MKILWIDPIVKNDEYLKSLNKNINLIKNNTTNFDIESFENYKNYHE